MKEKISLLSVICTSVILFSCAKDIVDLTGSVSGTIKDFNSGQLISNCKVSLSPTGQSQTSSAEGSFRFSDLEPGDYTLTFVKSGYSDETATATIVAGKDLTVSVLMKAKSVFSISESVLDFGDLEATKTVYLQNNSDESVSYKITNIPQWAKINKTEGSVSNASSEVLTINVDRGAVGFGNHSQVVSFNYSGKSSGSVSLTLKMTKVELTAPSVSTSTSAENIKQDSFEIKGNITKTGGSQITSYGHCWSTSQNPTIADSKTDLGSTNATGSFTSSITGLAVNTTYYVKAYATNAYGTSYGEQVAITTQDVEKNVWDGNIATSFAGGSGTMGDPYLIETGGQLLLVKDYFDKSFKLNANIDLNKHNWLPFDFSGTLDGNGFQVSNLAIKREGDRIGLFSTLHGTVKHLKISKVFIDCGSSSEVGSLAGTAYDAIIVECSVSLDESSFIVGKNQVGGVCGSLSDNAVNKSTSIRSVTIYGLNGSRISGSKSIGGVIGGIGHSATIEKCNATGIKVSGEQCIGGILGEIYYGAESYYTTRCEVSQSFFKGDLVAKEYVGGIVGKANSVNHFYSWFVNSSRADVQIEVEKDYASGLIPQGDVSACYSNGEIICNNSQAKYVTGISGGQLSYTTITSNSSCYKDIGYSNTSKTITSVQRCDNITRFFKECYSEYASYWNFDNNWIWEGSVDGSSVKANCPRLAWE